jgi:hypothetical protein
MKYPKFLSVDLMEVSEGMVRDGIEFGRDLRSACENGSSADVRARRLQGSA